MRHPGLLSLIDRAAQAISQLANDALIVQLLLVPRQSSATRRDVHPLLDGLCELQALSVAVASFNPASLLPR
jgi:hypothetical protein